MDGSRLYSKKEIKDMVNQEFTEEFVRYLCRAPQSVIIIIMMENLDLVSWH